MYVFFRKFLHLIYPRGDDEVTARGAASQAYLDWIGTTSDRTTTEAVATEHSLILRSQSQQPCGRTWKTILQIHKLDLSATRLVP